MADENIGVVHTVAPSYLEKIETDIIAELTPLVSGALKVEQMPTEPANYDLGSLKGAIVVHYKGSQFTALDSVSGASQGRRMNFAIVLLTRELRGHVGAYKALDDIRLALQGATFQGAGPCEMVSDGLVDENAGLWRWDIVIGLNAPAVARPRQRPAGLMRPVTTPSQS